MRPSSRCFKRLNCKIGRESEKLVKIYLQKSGFQLLEERSRTYFAELDLVFRKNQQIHVVEVKTVSKWGIPYVSHRQKSRLKRALRRLAASGPYPRIHLALVHNGQIKLIWDFMGD